LAVVMLLAITACDSESNKEVTAETVSPAASMASEPTLEVQPDNTQTYNMAAELSGDLEGVNVDNHVESSFYMDERNRKLYLKINIDDKEKIIEIDKPRALNAISDMRLVQLGNNKKGVMIDFVSNTPESMSNSSPGIYESDTAAIAVTYSKHEIVTLLNLFESDSNSENNFIVEYKGDSTLIFSDLANQFSTEFKAYVSESLASEYKKGFENIDAFNIPAAMSQRYYYEIKANDIDADHSDEIVASKFIPGVYHNDVIGVVDYIYKYDSALNRYLLSKEQLWYNKLLERPMIYEKAY
jgi:hypothetical protein